jgi:hypothetical protein
MYYSNTDAKPVCPDMQPPLLTASGDQHYCGRGGSPCPSGYYCNFHPADRYAICCAKPGMPIGYVYTPPRGTIDQIELECEM